MRHATGLVATLFLLAGASPAMGEEFNREFHQTFDSPPGTLLRIQHGDGNVEIETWDKPEIDVTVTYRGEVKTIGFGNKQGFDVEFHQEGKTVRVIGNESGGTTFGVRYKDLEEYVYRVRAPAYVILELDGDDGDVSITGWEGDIQVHTDDGNVLLKHINSKTSTLELADGDLDIFELTGNLFADLDDGSAVIAGSRIEKARLRAADGDVILKQCGGNFDIEVDDGDIRLTGVRMGTGTLRTADGDVELGLLSSRDLDLDVQTDDGSVWVELEEGMSARFSIQSGDGRLELDLSEVADLQREGNRVSGSVHGGEGTIRIRTGDGDVTFLETGGNP